MTERDEIVDELRSLVRYYQQALHEFFDDTSTELQEQLTAIQACLNKDSNSMAEYRKMVVLIESSQSGLTERVRDLSILTERMKKSLEAV